MEEHQEENSFEKLALTLFGSYKKSLVSLFAIAILLAIPITINLVQQQQDLRQEAASDYPTGYSMTLSPSTVDPSKNTTITTSISSNADSGAFTGLRRYIFYAGPAGSTAVPTEGTPSIQGAYNPSSVPQGQIMAIDSQQIQSSSPPGFATPTKDGIYYVLINYYGNGYICDWDGKLWKSGDSQASGTCVNSGKPVLTVASASGSPASVPDVSVKTINVFAPQGTAPGAQVKITTTGTAGSIGTYIFRSSDGNPPNPSNSLNYPTNQNYPSGSLTANQFYKISAANLSTVPQTITLPPDPGKYYLVANAHSQTLDNWWQPLTNTTTAQDYVCSWDSRLLVNSGTDKNNPQLQVQNGNGTACNIGPQLLTVSTSSTTISPTGSVTVTQPTGGQQNPTGTINPTSGANPTGSISPNQSTATSNNQLAVAVQLPGIGSNTGDNPSPKNPTRDVEVWVYNTNNTVVKDITGKVTFDGTNTYKGTVDLGNDFQSGYYYVKLRLNNTLKKAVPGIVQINASGLQATPTTQATSPSTTSTDPCASLPFPKSSTTYIYQCELLKLKYGGLGGVLAANITQLPTVTLVPGDLDPNQDNNLDIQDYNMFISCYGSKSCNNKQQADFNDDGVVDGKDYNILARGFAIRQGD
jgi:hypothetical protein